MAEKVDAIEAGEKTADWYSFFGKILVLPIYFYFIGVPLFRAILLPMFNKLAPTWISGYEPPLPVYGPELNAEDYWMGWAYWIAKYAFFAIIMCICFMVLIWAKQESILYVPNQPIQFIEDNPPKYKSPEERGMKFKEIGIKTEDNLTL